MSGIEKERRISDYQHIKDWLEFNEYRIIINAFQPKKPVASVTEITHPPAWGTTYCKIQGGKLFTLFLLDENLLLDPEVTYLALIPLDGILYDSSPSGQGKMLPGIMDAIESADDLYRGQAYLIQSPRIRRCATCGDLIAENQSDCAHL